MASEEILHNRYAQALLEVARNEKKLDEIMQSLTLLSENFVKDKKFHSLLINPLISREEKKNIFDEILQKFKMEYPLNSFLYLLIDERREDLLHGIFLRYRDLYRIEKHRIHVYAETARELSPNEKHQLREALQKRLKKEVEIELAVKPELLGGLSIRWQNIIHNDTVQGKLSMLKELI